jgi:hypothetical protein
MTVSEYDEKVTKTSFATMFSPAFQEIRVLNPAKPTAAITKPTGMPKSKPITRIPKPRTPIVVGLIFQITPKENL